MHTVEETFDELSLSPLHTMWHKLISHLRLMHHYHVCYLCPS